MSLKAIITEKKYTRNQFSIFMKAWGDALCPPKAVISRDVRKHKASLFLQVFFHSENVVY